MGEVGDGLFTQVMHIRQKRAKGKKLDKSEREFYSQHKNLINIREKLSAEEQAEEEFVRILIARKF